MKKYIRESISDDIVRQARDLLKSSGDKGSLIDIPNHKMTIVWSRGAEESDIMSDGMIGDWLQQHGFDVTFETRDVEYTTSGDRNWKSIWHDSGHKAYLRNRLVMTVTW